MEPPAFASLAHMRVLLVPVGNIRRTTFDQWATEIRSVESIPLGDIPADVKDERARFMPSPLANGHIHLSYQSHPPSSQHSAFALFRPSELPLGVIGIASCSQSDQIPPLLVSFDSVVKEMSLHKSAFPASKNCFVFEDNGANLDLGERSPGLVVIPSMMANKRVHISTLLAGLCSHILGDFATVMQSLESPLGNEYLNATVFPSLPSVSGIPRMLEPESTQRDSLPPLPSHNSQPDLHGANGTTRSRTPGALKRMSTGPGTTPSRTASLPNTPMTTKKRPNLLGAASSHGRLFKVLADLFLLAGRHADSQIWYTEAIALFKGTQDAAWHASALEGLATIAVIEGWSGNGMVSGADDKEPWQDIVDKLTQAIALYHRSSPTSEPERTYPLLAYLYSLSVLRHASLLFSIWSAKGWGPQAFGKMLHPGPDPYLPLSALVSNSDPNGVTVTVINGRTSYADLERLATITGITRVQIATILAQVHGPWLLHLAARERIAVLQTVAGMFGALGYLRKEAYILRELLGSIMDLIVCGREESSGTRMSGTGLGIRGVPVGNGSTTPGTVGVRENPRVEGNDSVLRIVKHICRVHGVDLETVKLIDIGSLVGRVLSNGESTEDSGGAEEEGVQEPFGWPELQIGIIREAIAVAEALPDYPSVAQFSLSSLRSLHLVMSQSDQVHLYHTATRALATAIRRGDRRTVEYWAGRPIVSIEIPPLPFIRLPIEKPLSLLSRADEQSGVNTILTGAKDPFLYNPRKVASGQATQTVLVQNERFEVVMTLKNPFVFDLQLESLILSTSGVLIESEAIPMVIPANTYHPVTMTGKAVESGLLTIRGCVVQAPGGLPHEYILPLSTEEEEESRSHRRSAIESEVGRLKRAGLESRPWKRVSKRDSKQSNKAPVRFLECKVVPEQPLLRIRRTSLTHAAVMLYNGETSTIRLTLENVSTLAIDFIRLTFEDSTIAPAQQALAEGELSVFDTYETEYDLIHRPVFIWDGGHDALRVDAGEKTTVSVRCFGKVGCTSGAVHISYAYIHRDHPTSEGKPPDVFHTRQLSYPVVVTVYHMLECHGMDILPYSSITAFISTTQDDSQASRARKTVFDVDNVADWCLFSVDVRNTYGLPFEVTFERRQPDKASMTILVAPGSTSRIVMPIRKSLLSEEQVSQPIPTLSDRQFVVAKSNLSSTEERAQRELFWYREELFKTIQGRWQETGGTRSGELSLRQQRMTMPMLEALRTETARVQTFLIRYGDDGVETLITVDPSGSKYLPPPNEFVYLKTKVTNLSPVDLVLVANLSLEPAKHIIYQGVLTGIPIGRLAPGEAHEVEMPVAFLSRGCFDILAEVRALDSSDTPGPVGRGDIRAVVAADFP